MKVRSKKGATVIRGGGEFIIIKEEPTEVDDALNENPQFRMFLNMGIIEVVQEQPKEKKQGEQANKKGNSKQPNKK